MQEEAGRLSLQLVDGMEGITPDEWAVCAAGVAGGADNPFISHDFLDILEQSGSVGGDSGWQPRHLTLRGEDGRLLAAMPLYVKAHSYGEYVFDQGWANAFEQAGGRYYPKLLSAVPFTPVTGPRLLMRADAPAGVVPTMVKALERIVADNGLSGVHVTFPTAEQADQFQGGGWLRRTGMQYHWTNQGYGSFEDFLARFSSRKRKAVRKERQAVADSGLVLETLTGDAIEPRHWAAFDRLYRATSDRKWGWPYLTRQFFTLLGERMANQVVLVMARDGDRYVGGALNLLGGDTLYGRNWGGVGEYPFLHFETCYYRALDFAIERGLKRVEAGAQGEHKIQRGYLPVPTFSAHYLAHPGLRAAVADFLERESAAVTVEMELLATESPYRQE